MYEYSEESADERFGMNLRALREKAGMAQSALAAAMTERGHSWHQQTVGRVEAGRQSLRAAELEALANIFGTSVDRFTWRTAESNEAAFTYAAGTQVRMQYEVVADAIRHHLAYAAAAERLLARPPASDTPRVKAAREDVAIRLEEYSPDNAINEGIRRYEERAGGRDGADPEGDPEDT